MYKINLRVIYSDGSVVDIPGHVLFSDLSMAAARLAQMADNLDIMIDHGLYKTYTASIERVVETVDNK